MNVSLTDLPIILSLYCPNSTKTFRRIGNTRYFIIQNTTHRGDFVTIEQARQDCLSYGLKLATVKNLPILALIGRSLERMAFRERIKDTWCNFLNINMTMVHILFQINLRHYIFNRSVFQTGWTQNMMWIMRNITGETIKLMSLNSRWSCIELQGKIHVCARIWLHWKQK